MYDNNLEITKCYGRTGNKWVSDTKKKKLNRKRGIGLNNC